MRYAVFMSIADDLERIAAQEEQLALPAFDAEVAWRLGLIVRELAIARTLAIVADVRRFGQPSQQLFYMAMPGTTPDNDRWVERKANTVARFHRSSYAMGLKLEDEGATFAAKYALPDAEYATHGGSFPLRVANAGVVGCLTVSGLPQRADHELAVEAVCLLIERSYAEYNLQG